MSTLCRDDIDHSVFTDAPAFMRAIDARPPNPLPQHQMGGVSQTSAGDAPGSPGAGRRSELPAEAFFIQPLERAGQSGPARLLRLPTTSSEGPQ